MIFFIISFLVSLLSGLIAKRLKFPAPLLVGGIIGVSIFNIISSKAYSPSFNKFFLQVISGSYIGTTLGRKELKNIKQIALPSVFLVFGMLCVNIFMGTLIFLLSKIDYLSSLLSTVPGGVTETTLMAESMNANVSDVALMQLVRSIGSLIFFPMFINLMLKKSESSINPKIKIQCEEIGDYYYLRVLLTFIIGTFGGLIGYLFPKIPASQMVFSLLLVSAFNILFFKAEVPIKFKKTAQILTGVFVGTKVTYDTILNLHILLLPAILMMLGYIIFHSMLALFISRVFKMDKATMLFSSIPAGASDIALIASDFECHSPYIAIFQIIRLISCIVVFPFVIEKISIILLPIFQQM